MDNKLLILSLLFYTIHSQCTWDSINLGALSGSTIDCVFGDNNQYEVSYSPCRDDISCASGGFGGKYMAAQIDTGNNECAAYLATWDPSFSPEHSLLNGRDMYEFAFDNGQASPGCDSGRWLDVQFVCKENAYPYSSSDTECGEEDQNCHYYTRIFTNLACPGGGGALGGDSDLSGGWIFILILISCLFGYCMFGFLFMGLKMKEWTIPHAQFWLKVPSLVYAGCCVTKDSIMRLAGKETGDRA
eukprot:373326_1